MRAVYCYDFGPIDAPSVQNVPAPPIAPGEVRIAVHAAGVSFANLLVIQGKHQNKPPTPFTPGTEIAGVISEIGPAVQFDLKVGDRVCAGVSWGGFAEEAVAPAENVFKIPDSLAFAEATLFPTIYATGLAALDWRAGLAAGEVLLVHAAAGASGLAAVEIGRALGATVIATAGGPKKCAVAKAHGAHHTVDYLSGDIRSAVLDLTDGRGVDVVFDPVGGDVFDQSLRCVAPLARVLPIGFASGRIPEIPANLILVKNLTIIGVYWGFYMAWGKTQADAATRLKVRGLFDRLFAMTAAGDLNPLVDSRLPLEEFRTALQRVQERSTVGKIVLLPRG